MFPGRGAPRSDVEVDIDYATVATDAYTGAYASTSPGTPAAGYASGSSPPAPGTGASASGTGYPRIA